MTAAVLTTQRLELRTITEEDLDLHMALINTPAVMRHLGGVKTRAEIAEKHARSRALFAAEGFSFMMMWERTTGELVGHCGMKRVDNPNAPNPGDCEIGWLVREDCWRMGYAYEAMRAVIDWAFAVHHAPHLVALTSQANSGSWSLMEKLGMERRKDLDFSDPTFPPEDNPTIQYAITKAQWEAQRA